MSSRGGAKKTLVWSILAMYLWSANKETLSVVMERT